MSEAAPGTTPVTIFGQTYHLRGQEDPDYLRELARRVDRRMRDIADATGTADTLKLAILAALNLADETLEGRPDGESERSATADTKRRLKTMVSLLDEALAG